VSEDRQSMMADHEHYAELCALAAGGLLEGAALVDFQTHVKQCAECRSDYQVLSRLVVQDLQPVRDTVRQKLASIRTKPLPYARERFLRRARSEGVVFSREIESSPQLRGWFWGAALPAAAVATLVVLCVGLTLFFVRATPFASRGKYGATSDQVARLSRENDALNASVAQLDQSLAAREQEIQRLHTQLGKAETAAENLKRSEELARADAGRSSSKAAQLLDESRDREKLLADAKSEASRANALYADDEASLVAEMVRVTELTDKLRVASATLDMERQIAAAGQDVRELMAAKQLHVIDVRDADQNGQPGKAFGRVFLTEGKSLTFYAFDLDGDKFTNSKPTFEVWAVPEGSKNSARSLGFLKVDAKASGRRVLRVDNPELVKAINSVFVTVEPAGGKQPSGQKLLYAYLGAPNHP
jgi:Anti-sigma-K factor rskA